MNVNPYLLIVLIDKKKPVTIFMAQYDDYYIIFCKIIYKQRKTEKSLSDEVILIFKI